MHHPLPMRFGVALALALATAPLAMPTAQQPAQPATPARPPAQPAAPATPATTPAAPAAAPAPAKVLVPVATNTVTANPDAFYGQAVTITASVEQILSRTSFVVDQRRVGTATLKGVKGPTDVLVLVPNIQSPIDLKSYVTVMGEVVKFDPAEVAKKAKDYKLDLPADALAKYAADGTKPKTSPGLDFFDTGVALVTDKPADGVDSIDTTEGAKVCWG